MQPRPGPQIEDVRVADLEHWTDGPPLELFRELREKCPVHWTDRMSDYPAEKGLWSITRFDDIRKVSLDWQTFSSHLGGVLCVTDVFPPRLTQNEFLAMDPPRHDHIKALFQKGFTPKRIAEQEPFVRAIVTATLDKLDGRDTCDLVSDLAQPVVSRVIGEFVGLTEEEDQTWVDLIGAVVGYDDPDLAGGMSPQEVVDEIYRLGDRLVAERRERPRDDLASVLVHAEIEGKRLSQDEIIAGMTLLIAAGDDSTKATYCSGMRALMENPDQREILLQDPSLIPAAVEESLRMWPAFSHMRRTATCDTELGGRQIKKGDKVVMWYPSSNRDEDVYEDPDRFDVRRDPEHQAFGAGGRHFCLGAALARLELRILFEETLGRYPEMQIDGEPVMAGATFVNQLKTLPVRLVPR